jgi:O-acetyl-ADP-ribose deacetylase (regulator of RNase III)
MRKTIKGDITKIKVDAIVNAANESLLGGGGVDGAIHRAAGPELLEECKTLNGCKISQAKITKAYNLPSSFVIHTVGPVWKDGKSGEKELLKDAYWNSLLLAKENACKSVAFPNISTGVYGFPKLDAAYIAIETATRFINELDPEMDVIFVCFDDLNYKIYQEICPDFQLD